MEYFVLGYYNTKYFFTNLEEGKDWGGFFWQEKDNFEIIDNDTSYMIEEFDNYYDSQFTDEKTVRFIIPEFTLAQLRKVSLDPYNPHLFWNQDFLNNKLTAISYVEQALRKYPVKIDQLKKIVRNSFEDICLNYLKGYLEGILDKSDGGGYWIEMYWHVSDNDNYLKSEGNGIIWEDALVKTLKNWPAFDNDFICRNIVLYLHAIFNFEPVHYTLKAQSNFSNLYYFNIILYNDKKYVNLEIDIPIP